MQDIEYFYAAHSAYAYLGSAHFMQVARAAGRRIAHRPMDLHRVMEACGSTAFGARPEAHRFHFFRREVERWAEYRGVPLLAQRPRFHDHGYDLANRVLVAALIEGRDVDALAHRFLESHWAEDSDLGDAQALVALAGQAGFDGAALLAAAAAPAVAERYEANTREAIARGVVGSPTYFVDGDMFYGQDRLELLERACARPFADRWGARRA